MTVEIEVSTALRTPIAKAITRQLERWAGTFLDTLRLKNVQLSIALIGDAKMRRLNQQWRGKEKTTDVLSFPAGESIGPGPRALGDIAISLPVARKMAKSLGTSVEHEVRLYLAHGLLHLLGHDHERPADQKKMLAAERKLLGAGGMLHRSS